MELKAFEGQNLEELSLIEVAHEILVQKGDVIEFNELLLMIQDFLKLDESELEQNMVRFYTDLNIDGRFISLGENRWGLRLWYPIDSIDEETITSAEEEAPKRRRKKRKINAFGDDEDMIDYNDDDPEDGESYDEDEDFDEENDMDDIADVVAAEDEDDDDDDEELDVYASDLSNFDDDIDEEAEFENEDEDEEEEEVIDEYEEEDYDEDEYEDD
ncbi:DNA-directed RNA polymerase subunit delta [Tuanshanicoccus lijuaniae]|uniref:DNA-directed RNA polymerase subunit delta n=1 Tax=Aerococcaceae bacterium zg-1292 TaxID=2774330 RepID=UPI001937C226|nr:DNA-directed RNA polymerase subunit delta [Aerococcaceae bacterium zg-1292]MBF6626812.1 DNA-directed RNA polymerase subunit delta [Aerococcaceae bacterium zg-BR9]MBF6979274.1 DNA-directed RNA polymerase subunit delta [Aerococcaceae bacterium zg-BR22]MBS4456926.1 DNA-directed RNA polymerase subunit delta [Aerococcaceae bacterium zg-A91]MBS4458786.1 DNA-directed RNA polymerase subunit delta [Aerococcaceae bacterium zg-BR33]